MAMKLMLADDHQLFLEGLQYMLETFGIEVAGIAQDGKEALDKARILKPDIILMDIKMPVCSGIDALRLIKAEMPEIKIVMFNTSDEEDDLFNAVKYGASGYLLKNTNVKDLVNMLSDLEKGEVSLLPGLAARPLKEFECSNTYNDKISQQTLAKVKRGKLTERQLEVLNMVARGITYREAGDALGLTERTVKYHMGRIIELLHLENRSQAIAHAARIGLVEVKKTEI